MAENPRDIIQTYFRKGDPLGAFEAIYANARAQGGLIPWDDRQAAPLLAEWAQRHALRGDGQRALVVGCGTGEDAELLQSLGFSVTAFDISPSAIALCHERWPHSSVAYTVADLLNLPPEWHEAYDFVLESRTLQAMPWQMTEAAIRAICACVRPGGSVLVLCLAREPEAPRHGIPWPLSRLELATFEQAGMRVQQWESFLPAVPQFRIHYVKG
jgi:SAM-dependent methyltransferase